MFKEFKNKKILNLFRLLVFILVFNLLSKSIFPSNFFTAKAESIDVARLVKLVNKERKKNGLNELIVDSRLVNAARKKAADMFEKDYWSHFGPNGETPWDFILAEDYQYVFAGENLAKDFTSTDPIHNAWMMSPTHKSNILNKNFENIGIAAIQGDFDGKNSIIVVQMFGKEKRSSNQEENFNEELFFVDQTGTLEAPEIDSPENGIFTNNSKIQISGKIVTGDKLAIFDKYEKIFEEEIHDQKFDVTTKDSLDDGTHYIYARTYAKDGVFSKASNIVTVHIDTQNPQILKETLKVNFVQIGTIKKNFAVSFEVEEANVGHAEIVINDKKIPMKYEDGYFKGIFSKPENNFGNLKIDVFDKAGNYSTLTFLESEISQILNLNDYQIEKKSLSIIDLVKERVLTKSLSGQINLIFIFLVIFLLLFEYLVLSNTGFSTQKFSSIMHIGLFFIILLVSFVSSGGTIL